MVRRPLDPSARSFFDGHARQVETSSRAFVARRGRIAWTVAVGTAVVIAATTLFWVSKREARAEAPPIVLQSGDTVNVFGETFATVNGAETQRVEAFTVSVVPGRRYLIWVARGTGSPALTKADVFFNRLKISTIADIPGSAPFMKVVAALAADTLDVRVAGSAGANIEVFLKSVPDPTYTIRGPIQYNKSNQFVPDTFAVVAPPASAPYYGYVINGPAGTNRANSLDLRLNGVNLAVPPEFGSNLPGFVIPLSLVNGQNILSARVGGPNGAAISIRTVSTDVIPPFLTVTNPVPGLITNLLQIGVFGTAKDSTLALVTVNGVPTDFGPEGGFDPPVALPVEGNNAIVFRAFDRVGLVAEVVRTVIRDTHSPVLNVMVPTDELITSDATLAVSGTFTDLTAVTVNVNGTPLTLQGGSFSGNVPLSMGMNVLLFTATDVVANATTVVRHVTRSNTVIPPDPSTVAPGLNRTVATTMFDATQFLYTGATPIQTDVTGGTIDPTRVAVIRGKVKARADTAISGVEISIQDHPEFGKTFTRADGAFDIAVNGGQFVAVNYRKGGLLPVQRPLHASSQQYENLEDVVMIPLDTAMTVVNFTAPITVHRASPVTDNDGTRRATLLFQQGTQATMVLPDNSTQPLSSISVRATEFTIGQSGGRAMPGPLPPTSGYTYAAELSADEAIANGARTIQFSKSVPVYLENFPGFAVGLPVPAAVYDTKKAAWIPEANGKIIKIVGVTGGLVNISLDTLGTVADSATLAAIGMTPAERQTLVGLYAVGQSLWRIPVTHFSSVDANYPSGPENQSPGPDGTQGGAKDGQPPCRPGSIIECTTQVLGENRSVFGAPFQLAYRSGRTRGYVKSRTHEIQLTGPTVAPNLVRVDLEIHVAGQRIVSTFPATANQKETFTWNGKDAYGRVVQGEVPMTVRVGYTYPREYYIPSSAAASFGLPCRGQPSVPGFTNCIVPGGQGITNGTPRAEITLWNEQVIPVGALDASALGLGGWGLDVHHFYDLTGRTLYLGGGNKRVAEPVIHQIAGIDTAGFSGDGGQATLAKIWDPYGLRVGPDNALYFADQFNHRVRRIAPNGIITTVAGTGVAGHDGDGGPATQAKLGIPFGVAFGPDGSMYIAEGFGQPKYIRRVDLAGIITTIAGSGSGCDRSSGDTCGDGGPALQASLEFLNSIDVGPDGTIYTSDFWYVIRRIGTDGIINRIAGDSLGDFCNFGGANTCGDGGAAAQASFDSPLDVAVGPDGSVYVSDATRRVRRITPDGVIRTVAGTGASGFTGDGGPAVLATVTPDGIAVGPDGSLFIVDDANRRVRRVGPDGIIRTIAGTGSTCNVPFSVNCPAAGAPAAQVQLKDSERITLAPNGSIYVSQRNNGGDIRRIDPLLKPFTGAALAVASEDGSQLFEFDAAGRHLRTRDALTSFVLLSFGYDGAGRLVTVTDADNNITALERNGSGALTGILNPFGKRTIIGLDARGFLATVANPAGETITAQHDTLGLLRSLTDAKGNPAQKFAYSELAPI